jgi:hypothetical protein
VKLYVLSPQLKAIDDCSFQGQSSLHPNDKCEAMHVHQIHDNVPLEVMERVVMAFAIQLLVNYEILCVLSPQLKAMDDCNFQEESSLNPKVVSESIHMHQIHDNVPLEMVERVIMFFSIQLLVNCEIICVITPIEGNQ